ncbi:MAG: type II toxin-antitoxin system VapC family toxin [Armatimonadetes bacterium]|nr:type II toxin-antitoxin system VapC family toxin [Armatimonadota bacterium]
MSLVFWDTNLFVYLMEDHPQYGPRVTEMRARMLERRDRLCTSALTLGELLTAPYTRGDERLALRYKEALAPPHVDVLPFSRDAAEHYARIRVDKSIAPADAVQLACAAQAGVDLFLTNDRRLSRRIVPGVQFIADLDVRIL